MSWSDGYGTLELPLNWSRGMIAKRVRQLSRGEVCRSTHQGLARDLDLNLGGQVGQYRVCLAASCDLAGQPVAPSALNRVAAGLIVCGRMGTTAPEVAFDTMMERSARSMKSGILFDVKRFALHDGPGIRTTAFLKGCPLSCLWCHNPESQSMEPELVFRRERCVGCGACVSACAAGAISMRDGTAFTDRGACTACGECVDSCPGCARAIAGEAWTVARLLDEVERDVLFYDESGGGVTLSGGEPLAQVSFAASLLAECRDRRIHTTVDTCGHGNWEDLERVAGMTDLFLYDVKHTDDDRHRELTGVSNRQILENLRRLDNEGQALWIRYPVIPDLNDADEDIAALGGFVSHLKAVEAIHLLPFHRGGEKKLEQLGRSSRPLSTERDPRAAADAAAQILRAVVGVPVYVGG